jgi:hypothetical protein
MVTILSIFLVGFAYYYFRMRHNRGNILAINLISETSLSGDSRIWLAPIKFSDSDVAECFDGATTQKSVWLAPVLPSIDINLSQEVISSNDSVSSADNLLPCSAGDLKHLASHEDNVWLAPIGT